MDTAVETLDLRAESIHGGSAYSCITGFTSNLTDPADVNRNVIKTDLFNFKKQQCLFTVSIRES